MNDEAIDFMDKTASGVRVLLAYRGWTQTQLAERLNVDQPWISNLLRGKLHEVNDRVRQTHKYVIDALPSDDLPEAVKEAIRGYILVGGDVKVLAQWIWSIAYAKPVKRSGRFASRPTRHSPIDKRDVPS